jgi:hypothetical protein
MAFWRLALHKINCERAPSNYDPGAGDELPERVHAGGASPSNFVTALRHPCRAAMASSALRNATVSSSFLGILASRVLASIVYQATPRDPLVLAGVVAVMALLGLLATWIPARRALSIDPLILLREE